MASPAAVLSILVKAQGVQAAAGQLGALDKTGRRAGAGLATTEKQAKRTSKTFSVMGTAAKSAGLLVGAAGLAAGAKVMVSEYREAQKVGAQTNAVLKSTGNAAKTSKKQIEDLAGAISKKSGIDDEAIQSGENLLLTFTKIRNEQGAGNKIFDRATQVITDMSVALKQGVKPSAIQVGKALQDPIKGITALRRVGVNFNAQQSEQIKKMVESGHQLEAQRTILRELNKEFGGSAAAQATAGDKLSVSLHNLAEAAGGVLVPQLDKAAVALTHIIDDFVQGKGIATVIIPIFKTLGTTIAGVASTISSLVQGFKEGNTGAVLLGIAVASLTAAFVTFKTIMLVTATATKAMAAAQVLLNLAMTANPIGILIVSLAALGVALVLAYKKFETFRNVVNATFSWIKANWPLVLGILTGPIGLAVLAIAKNWTSIRNAFTSGVAAIVGILRGSVSAISGAGTAMGRALINSFKAALNFAHELAVAMRDLISKAPGYALGVGKAIVSGIINGIKAAAGGIGNALKGAVKGATPDFLGIGDGIGKGIGAGSIVPVKGGGNLMGARPIMSRFAAVGAANGLHVSDGKRAPGTKTSSGGVSWHSTGEAIDLAGPPAGMLKTFKTLRSRFGSKLAELIHTPGGAGIKDGKPYVYTGAIAADHFDHVHVAFDSGKPGLGDGPGRARAAFTGDGPGSNPNAKRIWQFLISKGLTPAQAAGVLGNLSQESGFDPGAIQKGGPGRGLAQWGGGRFTALQAFAKKRGKPWTDLNTQLQFMWSELQGPEAAAGKALRSAHTVADATSVFGSQYERFGVAGNRSGPAIAAFNAFKGAAGSAQKAARSTGAAAAGKVNPYDQSIASADVGIADAGHAIGKFSAGLRTAAALRVKQKIVGSRIRAIRAALKKKGLTSATRLRLTQELAQLIPEHAQLGVDRQAALAGPAPEASIGSGGEDGGDPNQALIDSNAALQASIDAQIAAEQEHTAAITALKDEIDKQNAIAGSTIGIGLREAQRALADMISGQLGGYGGAAGRALTAGSGEVVRY